MQFTNIITIILSLLFISDFINCGFKPQLYKCIHNVSEERNPLPNFISEVSVKQKEDQKRRIQSETDSDGFKDFNIYLDLANIRKDIEDNHLEGHSDFFIESMQKAVNVFKSILKVKPLQMPYALSDQNFDQLEIRDWDKDKFGTTPRSNGINLQSLGIDLVIFAKLEDLPETTLASANARAFTNDTIIGQPYIGILKINKIINYTLPNAREYFQSVLVHELTHIIGFSYHFFDTYYHNIFTKKDDYGIDRYYLNSPKLLQIARKYFDCPTLEGVELENQGGTGTEASHWEARILLGEYMTGYAYTEEQVISEFTLAVLEDSGYYKVKYYTGGLMRFGKHKGCSFLKERCINPSTHKMNEKFENEFFDSISEGYNIESSCSSGRQSRTYNYFYEIELEQIPEEYRYYTETNKGGYQPADFCPVPIKIQDEEDLAYYSGHCFEKGKKYFGSMLSYHLPTIDGKSEALIEATGEVLSDHSFCFLSSLTKSSYAQSSYISFVVRANCYEMFCSEKSLTVKIFDDYIVCPRAGGKINVKGYNGYLLCPDYNLMCSGTVLCNNMFDCIESQSEIKDTDYTYDYEIKTSQNIQKSKSASVDTDNYELSTAGKCSKNCKHCKSHSECLECRDDYGLKIEENGDKNCYSMDDLSKGYYKNEENDAYEKCMENCLSCKDKESCELCSEGYIYKGKKCEAHNNDETLISNCQEYDEEMNCIKCKSDYALNDTKKDKCFNIETDFINYFTRDNISYILCTQMNKNCSICDYENSVFKCLKCIDNFVFKDIQGNCMSKDEVVKDNEYYLKNNTHVGLCSEVIEKCISCYNESYCSRCENGFSFVVNTNGNGKNECVNNSNTKTITIDKEENNSYYFSFIYIIELQYILLFILLLGI